MQQMGRAWEVDAWEWMCEVECSRGLGRGKWIRGSGFVGWSATRVQ